MHTSLKDEIKYLERKLLENPASVFFARLASAYLQSDRLDEAIKLCEAGVKKHPTYVTGHFILGKCYLKNNSLDQAEKEFKLAIKYDPKYLAAHREYGEMMAQIGWHTTCDLTFEEIIRIDPLNEKAQKRLAEFKKLFFPQKVESNEKLEDLSVKEENDRLTSDIHLVSEAKEQPSTFANLKLGSEVQTEPEEKDESEFREQYEASMDLLEDIFRDTTIPDLDTSDLPVREKRVDRDEKKSNEAPIKKSYSLADLTETASYEKPTADKSYAFSDEEKDFAADFSTEKLGQKEEPPSSKNFLDQQFKASSERIEEKSTSTSNSNSFSRIDSLASSESSLEEELPPPVKESFTDPFFGLEQEKLDIFDTFEQAGKVAELGKQPPVEQGPRPFQTVPTATASELAGLTEKEMAPADENQDKQKEKIVTPTLGEIYAAQHQYSKAISVYATLLKKDPNNTNYLQKIEYLQKKLEEFGDS